MITIHLTSHKFHSSVQSPIPSMYVHPFLSLWDISTLLLDCQGITLLAFIHQSLVPFPKWLSPFCKHHEPKTCMLPLVLVLELYSHPSSVYPDAHVASQLLGSLSVPYHMAFLCPLQHHIYCVVHQGKNVHRDQDQSQNKGSRHYAKYMRKYPDMCITMVHCNTKSGTLLAR